MGSCGFPTEGLAQRARRARVRCERGGAAGGPVIIGVRRLSPYCSGWRIKMAKEKLINEMLMTLPSRYRRISLSPPFLRAPREVCAARCGGPGRWALLPCCFAMPRPAGDGRMMREMLQFKKFTGPARRRLAALSGARPGGMPPRRLDVAREVSNPVRPAPPPNRVPANRKGTRGRGLQAAGCPGGRGPEISALIRA